MKRNNLSTAAMANIAEGLNVLIDQSVEKAAKKLVSQFATKREQIEWLSPPEVIKLLRISKQTLINWTEEGRLKSYSVKGKRVVRYKRSEVNKAMELNKF